MSLEGNGLKEIEALKAQVQMTREQLTNCIEYIRIFEMQFCSVESELWEGMPKSKLNYSNAKSIIDKTPEQCLNQIKADAIEKASNVIYGACDGEVCYDLLSEMIKELRE